MYKLEMASSGSEFDANGWAAIHHAAFRGAIKTLDKLLHDIDTDTSVLLELKTEDNLGSTPLQLAVTGGHIDAVRWLIDLEADVNVVNLRGQGVVELAAVAGYKEHTSHVNDRPTSAEQATTTTTEEVIPELSVEFLK